MVAAEKKIEKRASYWAWERDFKFIKKHGGNPYAILPYIYRKLDDNRAFGSRTASFYSQESLNLVLKQNKENDKCSTRK